MVTLGGFGVEWIVDASGCTPAHLVDRRALDGVFRSVVESLGLHPIGRAAWHRFPVTRGLTGLLMLKESHLACHTFPEFGGACFNLYCCRPRPAWPWREELSLRLGATRVGVRQLRRRYGTPAVPRLSSLVPGRRTAPTRDERPGTRDASPEVVA